MILAEKNKGFETRTKLLRSQEHENMFLMSKIEPKNFKEANKDENWVNSMNEELDQIEKSETWELVRSPKDKNVIGAKWDFRKKMNEDGKVVRNKEILVCNLDILKLKG